MKISRVGGIDNPGRIYRVMFCPDCGDCRYHTITFIEAERSDQGIFAWFTRRCTGVSPVNDIKPRMQRLTKDCGREAIEDLPATQWKVLVQGGYF